MAVDWAHARQDISAIGDPTLADAIVDRHVNNAYRIDLKGESMSKRHAKLTTTAGSE